MSFSISAPSTRTSTSFKISKQPPCAKDFSD
jgi:hypothetical protein